MFHKILITTVCCLSLVACETVQNNQRTAIGAGLGAALGAAAGTLVGGNDRRNALVGAGIGLLAGAAVGQYLDRQQRDLEQNLAGTGADVTRVGDQLLVSLPGGVTFNTDSATIAPAFYGPLNSVAVTLNKYPESFVDVIGHTDNVGSAQYNQTLSERRAQSVSGYLTGQGVAAQRLVAFGQGFSQPIADNSTAAGRAQNRRVELRITPATQG